MMTTIESYVRNRQMQMKKWALQPGIRLGMKIAGYFLGGLVLSGASLAHSPLPLTMSLLCVVSGWQAVVLALGGAAGYLAFWGQAGLQGLLWLGLALPVGMVLGKTRFFRETPLMMPALASLLVAASGLTFQILMRDTTSVPVYLLRVAVAAGSAKLFELVRDRRDPVADWAAQAVGVLALAQVVLFPGFSLGYLAAGMLAAVGAFPAAALAGLALDLAQVTPTPMTAVLSLAYLVRLIPFPRKWIPHLAPACVYLLVMGLCGVRDFSPVAGLILGGGLGLLVPQRPELSRRRGETGMIQVQLELMSVCLGEMQQMLLEAPEVPIDEASLLARAKERACGGCPNRRGCQSCLGALPGNLLHRPLPETSSLPFSCKKPGRMIQELRRSQEQLRSIKADRERQGEYRRATIQQYQFLSHFLQHLSDQLPRSRRQRQKYHPEISVCTAGRDVANGDRVLWFAGAGCKYYILLCDGMGTGIGAAEAGQTAAGLLQRMLRAGFPGHYALRSVNSMLTLRGQAGAVTMDLAEVSLDTGRVQLYKWGAAPSYVLREEYAEKIGTAGPPPGLSVADTRETTDRLSLRRGEVLILLSDGVDGEAALRRMGGISAQPPGELAAKILEYGARENEDDATVAAICLYPGALST